MIQFVHARGASPWARSAPAVLIALAALGPLLLLAMPARELADSRSRLERARAARQAPARGSDARAEAALLARLDELEARLAGPAAPAASDAFELAVLFEVFARSHDLELAGLERERTDPTGRRLSARGRGRLADWSRLLSDLAEQGAALRVEQFHVVCEAGQRERCEVRLVLAPAVAPADATEVRR